MNRRGTERSIELPRLGGLSATCLVLAVGAAFSLPSNKSNAASPQFQVDEAKGGAAVVERMTLPLVTRFILDTDASGAETVFNLASAVSVGDTVFIGTTAGTVVAARRRTGAVSWTAQTGG